MGNFVLDSFAILSYLNDEPGSTRVKELFLAAKKNDNRLYMNWINMGEVFYIVAKKIGKREAFYILSYLKQLPMNLIVPSPDYVLGAAEIKSQFPMSYADCFAVFTAIQHSAAIVTGDPEFKLVTDLVPIEWLPKQ